METPEAYSIGRGKKEKLLEFREFHEEFYRKGKLGVNGKSEGEGVGKPLHEYCRLLLPLVLPAPPSLDPSSP